MNRGISILCSLLLLLLLSGCSSNKEGGESTFSNTSNTIERSADNSANGESEMEIPTSQEIGTKASTVPFLIESDGEAFPCEWSLENQTVSIGNEAIYQYNTETEGSPTVLQNGNNSFLFRDNKDVTVFGSYNKNYLSELTENPLPDATKIIGRNVIAQSKGDPVDQYDFTIIADSVPKTLTFNKETVPAEINEKIIEANAYLCFIEYEDGKLTAIFQINEKHELSIITYQTSEEKWNMQISSYGETVELIPFKPYCCVKVGDEVFFVSGIDISSINLSSFDFEAVHPYYEVYTHKLKELIKTDLGSNYPIPYSGTGDILLIDIDVSSGEFVERITFAFENSEYLGALHYRDGTFYTYDAENKRTTAMDNVTYDRLVYANNNGV